MLLKPYDTGDELAILSLFKECYGREMSAKYWKWRFIENPYKKVWILLAWDKNTLAAHYAVSPVLLLIKGQIHIAALSLTTMTHPKYRGLKLFPKLASKVYEVLFEMNYTLVFGFPNKNSHRTFIKNLRWRDIYEIPTFKLYLNNNQKVINDSFVNSICEYSISEDNEFDLCYSTNITKMPIQLYKDKSYLKWRYKMHPQNKYYNFVIASKDCVSSFCVVKKYVNSLDIVDFQAENREEGEALLAYVIKFALSNRFDQINCWAPRHHFFHSLCEKYGFINGEPITYFCYRYLSNEENEQFFDTYSNWYIQMGDSDVY